MTANDTWQKQEWILLGALFVLSLALRLGGLGHVPPGVRFDELVNVKMADHIYAGEWPIYFQEAWGHEPLYHYFHALGMQLLGQTVLGVRITSVLFGVLGVFTVYLVVRTLFDRRVAAVTALFLATSFWSLMYSRVGLRHISLPPWIGLSAYCFWRGLHTAAEKRKRVLFWFALGGLCMGIMLYTYFASRVVPVIFVTFTLYLILWHREKLRKRWAGLALFFVLPAVTITPMLLYLNQHPELEQRLGQVGGDLFTALRAGDLGPMLQAIVDTLKMFSLQGDPEWLYNISGQPVFDPATSILFYGGLFISLWHWREPRHVFVLLWLAIGIAPAMLSWPPGSLGHTIAAQPVVYVFPALAIVQVWRWAQKEDSRWLQVGMRTLAIILVIVFVAINSYHYFVRWPRYDEVRHEYQAPVTAVARYLQQRPPSSPTTCVSAPYVDYWNPWSKMNFELYAPPDDRQPRWFNGSTSILFPAERPALFFVPDHVKSPSELDTDLGSLLMAGSQLVHDDYQDRIGSSFDLYRWEDATALEQRIGVISTAPVWSSPEGPYVPAKSENERQELALPSDFGHRLALLGYNYEAAKVGAGEAWRVNTYWRVLTPTHEPLAIFIHILDDANTVRAGWDGLHVSPESWETGDVFIQAHLLSLPGDTPVGTQRVELGVYSPITMERLALFTTENDTAPYNRALLRPITVR